MKNNFIIAGLGIVASIISVLGIVNDFPAVLAVFQLSDPSVEFGTYFHFGGLLANLGVIFICASLILAILSGRAFKAMLISAAIAFVPELLGAAAVLPCYIGRHRDALCGVGAVMVAYYSIPIILAATLAFVLFSRSWPVRVSAIAGCVVVLGFYMAGSKYLSPKDATQCLKLPDDIKRSTCLGAFANKTGDENLCRSIEFRTTRFTCLREVGVKNNHAELCEEIRDRAAIPTYESPAAFYRDTCFQSMAYSLHDHQLCAKIEDAQLRGRCETGIR
jgi:hypothetical protein